MLFHSIKQKTIIGNNFMSHPRLLIVGTTPYNTKDQSRSFDAFFHYWEKENIAQIFCKPQSPVKGHCGTLFQITDYRMLERWKGKKLETGKVYLYDELPDTNESDQRTDETQSAPRAYKFGLRHSPLTHLLRGLLWRKKFWCTDALNKWLDKFNPECIFLSFSDDYFIPQIALYVAERYNIPIVSSILDDYYFNMEKSINPLYWWYKLTYKKLIRKVLAHKGRAIYISDKIRDKYNRDLGIDGETVYLTSNIKRKPFTTINIEDPLIIYFGNIGMGRNHSLNEIGYALGQINPKYKLEVYSGAKDSSLYEIFKNNPNIIYGGTIPYERVQEKMQKSDITVIVEGFRDEDINLSRYSLSTKAADALASGATILTYGSQECGIVEYMQSTNASFVCTDKNQLVNTIKQMLERKDLQEKYYHQAIVITNDYHNIKKSCATVEMVVAHAMKK